MTLRSSVAIALILILGCATLAFSQNTTPATSNVDVRNLEAKIPSCVEDAYVLPYHHFEAQSILSWGDGDWDNWWEYRLQAAMGLTSNCQATIGWIGKDNKLDQTGDGDVFLKLMRQFHTSEKDAALFGINLNFPSGQDYARLYGGFPPYNFVVNQREDHVDVGVTGVYTKILSSDKLERLHLQATETYLRSAPAGFATSRLSLGAACDKLIRDDTLAIASLCWTEGANRCNPDATVLGLGLRHQESPRFLWGAGVKIGLDWPEANWGLVWGAQYGL